MINVIQLGLGNVGLELLNQIKVLNNKINVIAVSDDSGYLFEEEGLDIDKILKAKNNKRLSFLKGFDSNNKKILSEISSKKINNCVIVDVTASGNTIPILIGALNNDLSIVLANKKPISSNFNDFNILNNSNKVFFECTVGAGLPIIYTIKSLLKTGDLISEINGCFSGTLGYIFSEFEKEEQTFSEIVKKAKNLGYTEPDPRDDLSGVDVARKALILARCCGYNLGLKDIKINSLVPKELINCTVIDFMRDLKIYDNEFSSKYKKAKEKNMTLRYIASIMENQINVGIKEAPINSELGMLKGTDNICIINSSRYQINPLVIKGPGAGIKVTADGVLRNILECFNR